MKKGQLRYFLQLYGVPISLIVFGLVLSFSPDTASALIAAVLGWILIGTGVCLGIAALLGAAPDRVRMTVAAVILLGLGIFIVSFPLVLARLLGRILGVVLLVRGIANTRDSLQRRQAGFPYGYRMGAAIVMTAAGVVLILLPMTLSRILMNICGIVLIVVGIVYIISRYEEKKQLNQGQDPNIIDADP